jgi:hypothetical protein
MQVIFKYFKQFLLGSASPDEPSTSAVGEITPPTSSTVIEDREQPVAESAESATGVTVVAVDGDDQQDSPSKAKRKNRCTTCRKKVGLTGKCLNFLSELSVLVPEWVPTARMIK